MANSIRFILNGEETAVEGIAMYAVFAALEGRMTGWAFRSGVAAN